MILSRAKERPQGGVGAVGRATLVGQAKSFLPPHARPLAESRYQCQLVMSCLSALRYAAPSTRVDVGASRKAG